ncbi:MAG: dockerin type I repeat-containing protein [Pseudomonadota bacterium]
MNGRVGHSGQTRSAAATLPMVLAVFQFAVVAVAYGQAVPSNMQVTGTITTKLGVTLQVNDNVLVVRETGGQTEGTGTVLAADGTYFVDMSKTTSFNGTRLSMRLVNGGRTFQLLSGTAPVSFQYSGGFPFPVRLTISPTVGDLIVVTAGDSGGGGGAQPSPGSGGVGVKNDKFDVNGDGVLDDLDIRIIKDAVTGKASHPKADVNGDGIVNTRDVIDAIKALHAGRVRTFAPTTSTATPTTSTTGTTTTTTGTGTTVIGTTGTTGTGTGGTTR